MKPIGTKTLLRQWTRLILKLKASDPSGVSGIVDEITAFFVGAGVPEYRWLNRLLLLLRELPYPNAFRVIEHLEKEITAGSLPNIGCGIVGKDKADEFERIYGREVMEDYWPVYMSAVFAHRKHLWHQLGLISAKAKGDLRTAFLVEDKAKLLAAVLRTKFGREHLLHPEIQSALLWARTQTNDRRVSDRIRKAMKATPRDIPQFSLKDLLIDGWATAHPAPANSLTPPLAYFSDLGLDAFLINVGADTEKDSSETSRTRKIWEHLGLRRSTYAGLGVVIGLRGPTMTRPGLLKILEEGSPKRCPRLFPSVPLPP